MRGTASTFQNVTAAAAAENTPKCFWPHCCFRWRRARKRRRCCPPIKRTCKPMTCVKVRLPWFATFRATKAAAAILDCTTLTGRTPSMTGVRQHRWTLTSGFSCKRALRGRSPMRRWRGSTGTACTATPGTTLCGSSWTTPRTRRGSSSFPAPAPGFRPTATVTTARHSARTTFTRKWTPRCPAPAGTASARPPLVTAEASPAACVLRRAALRVRV